MVTDNRRCSTITTNLDAAPAANPADGVLTADICPDGAHASPSPAPEVLAATGDLLRALAAPVRISIVLALRDGDQCVHQLVDRLHVTQPLVSQHLRVLKSAGVVHGERHGREITYSLVDDHLAHIVIDAVAHASERP